MQDVRYPPRLFADADELSLIDKSKYEEAGVYLKRSKPDDIEYLSVEEHKALIKKAIADTWEDAALKLPFSNSGTRLADMFLEKANEIRGE